MSRIAVIVLRLFAGDIEHHIMVVNISLFAIDDGNGTGALIFVGVYSNRPIKGESLVIGDIGFVPDHLIGRDGSRVFFQNIAFQAQFNLLGLGDLDELVSQ